MSGEPRAPLRVTPEDELEWQLVVGRQLTNELTLHNVTSSYVTFKVKTTAPKQYCVRPNMGVIAPNASQQVLVFLQPLKETAGSEKWKDKFLVQSIVMEGTEEPKKEALKKIWDQVDKDKRSMDPPTYVLTDRKLRCKFIPPTKVKSVPEEGEAQFASAASRMSSVSGDSIRVDKIENPAEKCAIFEERLRRAELEKEKMNEMIEELRRNLASKNEEHRKLISDVQDARRLVGTDAGLKHRGSSSSAATEDSGKSLGVREKPLQAKSGGMDVKVLLLVVMVAIGFFIAGRLVKT